jgi:hypothetical protein
MQTPGTWPAPPTGFPAGNRRRRRSPVRRDTNQIMHSYSASVRQKPLMIVLYTYEYGLIPVHRNRLIYHVANTFTSIHAHTQHIMHEGREVSVTM